MTTPIAPTAPRGLAGVRTTGRYQRRATRIVVLTLGAVVGLAGIEHGIGEILQGNVAPDGIAMLSWPESHAFRITGGEPALTIVPNLQATGILAIGVSLALLIWVGAFVQRKHGGLVLLLLSLGMLLFGGGVAPPLIGGVLGLTATRINAPLAWWRAHVPIGVRRRLGMWWPWALGIDVVALLLLVPGSVILGALTSADNPTPVPPGVVYAVILTAFAFLVLSVGGALAHDSLVRAGSQEGARE